MRRGERVRIGRYTRRYSNYLDTEILRSGGKEGERKKIPNVLNKIPAARG